MFSPLLACSNTRTLDLLSVATWRMCFSVGNPGKKTSSLAPAISPFLSPASGTSHSSRRTRWNLQWLRSTGGKWAGAG